MASTSDSPIPSPAPLRSRRIGELRDSVQRLTVVHEVDARRGRPDGLVTSACVGALNLVYVRYGAHVTVDAFPTRNRFALTVPLGPMEVTACRTYHGDVLRSGFVLSGSEHTVMRPDPVAGALVISAPMGRLEEHLRALTGRVPDRPLRFLQPGERAAGPASMVESAWRLACRTISDAGGALAPVIARTVEDALLSGVLLGLPHTGTADLLRPGGPGVSGGIPERVRAWLDEHYHEPVTVVEMARSVGVSVRGLQAAFRERFDATPTMVLRDIRLGQAHHLLTAGAAGPAAVSDVAHRCGFTHLGRFAHEYRKRFGEAPSETLRRRPG